MKEFTIFSSGKKTCSNIDFFFQTDTLWFFNDQLCRSIPMTYQKSVVSRYNLQINSLHFRN